MKNQITSTQTLRHFNINENYSKKCRNGLNGGQYFWPTLNHLRNVFSASSNFLITSIAKICKPRKRARERERERTVYSIHNIELSTRWATVQNRGFIDGWSLLEGFPWPIIISKDYDGGFLLDSKLLRLNWKRGRKGKVFICCGIKFEATRCFEMSTVNSQ